MTIKIRQAGISIQDSTGNRRAFLWADLNGEDLDTGKEIIPWKDVEKALEEKGVDLESEEIQEKIAEQIEARTPSEQELKAQERQRKRSEKMRQLREELRSSPAPQSNPELAKEVEKIKQVLGLRDIELDEE